MGTFKISDSVFYVGVQDWDRELFDEIIPLPQGTSYNSYIVKGEKVALIDAVDPSKKEIFLNNLKELKLEKIDFLIANHAEQDHSGAIPDVLSLYSMAKVITNEKCKGFLKDLLLIPEEKFITIKDQETISLGGKTLKFFFTPWVHWPETMVTYLIEDKILFPCDFLASHIATGSILSDGDEVIKMGAKRYYSEIMMPYRVSIQKHLKLLKTLDINLIAPSHGVIYKKPDFIIKAYEEWVSDKVKNKVIILYVSMHHSVLEGIKVLESFLIDYQIPYKVFNGTKCDIGELAMALVDAATLIVGTPVFLANPHPNISFLLSFINALRPKTRYFGLISSYSWGQRIEEQVKNILANCKLEYLPLVLAKGFPKEEEKIKIKELVENILRKHKEDEMVIK